MYKIMLSFLLRFFKRTNKSNVYSLMQPSRTTSFKLKTCPKKVAVVDLDEGIGVSTDRFFSQEMKTLEEKKLAFRR